MYIYRCLLCVIFPFGDGFYLCIYTSETLYFILGVERESMEITETLHVCNFFIIWNGRNQCKIHKNWLVNFTNETKM